MCGSLAKKQEYYNQAKVTTDQYKQYQHLQQHQQQQQPNVVQQRTAMLREDNDAVKNVKKYLKENVYN